MTRSRALPFLLGIVALGAVAFAPRPGIAISNRLTPARDARVVRSVLTPRAGWQAPYQWRITMGDTLRFQGAGAADTVIDSLTAIYAPCVSYRVTIRPVGARDSLTRAVSVCRGPTTVERALIDSYPEAGRRVLVCNALGDPGALGVRSSVVLMGTNRYTGAKRALVGNAGGQPCR